MNDDYYKVLGVSKTASDKEIKTAYRKLAMQWHPDKNKTQEAEKKFKEINQAYEVLSDPKKKQAYDQFGHTAFTQGAGGGAAGGNPFGGFGGPFTYTYQSGGQRGDFDFSDPFDIFEQFFGAASPFGRQARMPHVSISLTFKEAYKGVEKEITIDGKKRKIKIPKGVDDGSRIQFDDFFATIDVHPDKTFHREGSDLFVDVQIPFYIAIEGGEVEVPLVEGKTKIRIRPGTQPGGYLRLTGNGMPRLNRSDSGDMYIRLHIEIPNYKDLNSKQKEALKVFKK